MENEGINVSRTSVQKFLTAIGMFVATILVCGFLILLLSSTFVPILHEATIAFFYLGPPLAIICALNLAVCGWKGKSSFQSFISTGKLVVAYFICLFFIASLSTVLNRPVSKWAQEHALGIAIVLIFFLAGYLILQYKTLHHFSGVWRNLALMPLILMALAVFIDSVLGQMPVILLISSPFALVYLAILFFWYKFFSRKNGG
jgi:hypothetical protein